MKLSHIIFVYDISHLEGKTIDNFHFKKKIGENMSHFKKKNSDNALQIKSTF